MARRVYFAFHYQDVIDFRANVVRKHNFAEGVKAAGYYDYSIWEDAKKIDKCGHLIYPDGQNRGRGTGQIDRGQFDRVEEVLWPDGCAAMYRRAMLEDIGGFDEDFFALPPHMRDRVQKKIDAMGLHLAIFPHFRMTRSDKYRRRRRAPQDVLRRDRDDPARHRGECRRSRGDGEIKKGGR